MTTNTPRTLILVLLGASLSTSAWAGRCAVHNDTGETFTVESGNVSNQRLESHSQDSIESGDIVMKSDSGKSVGGHCNDGDRIEIVDQGGTLVLRPQ